MSRAGLERSRGWFIRVRLFPFIILALMPPTQPPFRRYGRSTPTSAGDQNRLRETTEHLDRITSDALTGLVAQRIAGMVQYEQTEGSGALFLIQIISGAGSPYTSWKEVVDNGSGGFTEPAYGLEGGGSIQAREINGAVVPANGIGLAWIADDNVSVDFIYAPNLGTNPTFGLTPQAPSSIGTNQNNYNPGPGSLFELTASAAVNITGWTAPAQDGQLLIIKNTGTNPITLTHQDSSSSSGNRFWLPYGQPLILDCVPGSPPGKPWPGSGIFIYQVALNGWLCIGYIPAYQYWPVERPTALSGNVNDYNPGFGNIFPIDGGNADRTITGLATLVNTDGAPFIIINRGSTNNLLFTNEDAGSAAANRFHTTSGATVTLGPGGFTLGVYDFTAARNRLIDLSDTDFYQTVQVNGTAQTQRGKLDLIAGTNITLTPTDDAAGNRTEVTIAASSGSDPVFVAAGASHAAGDVPDPGATAHTPPYYLGDDAAFHPIPTNTEGQGTLSSSYTPTTSYANIGCSVTLPNVGTYLLLAQITGTIVDTHQANNISAKLRNTTDSADIGDIGVVCYLQEATIGGANAQDSGTATLIGLITTTGTNKVIDIQAELNVSLGAGMTSATVGTARLIYTQLA